MHLLELLLFKVIGERLAVAGMAVAYGAEDFPSQGPTVKIIEKVENVRQLYFIYISLCVCFQVEGGVLLTYDQDIIYNDSELTGFFYCCGLAGECRYISRLYLDCTKLTTFLGIPFHRQAGQLWKRNRLFCSYT